MQKKLVPCIVSLVSIVAFSAFLSHQIDRYAVLYSMHVSSEDMSPRIPKSFSLEVEKTKAIFKDIRREIREQRNHEEALNQNIKEFDDSTQRKVEEIKGLVRTLNSDYTDMIAKVPEQVGSPGPPGLPALDGVDGEIGLPGQPGLQGPRGSDGMSGPPGSAGPPGPPGPLGLIGSAGNGGEVGDSGPTGFQGPEGLTGYTDSWDEMGFDCPAASTDTMRLVHCNRQGCRLETQFAGEWGTVCGNNFGAQNANILCKAFGLKSGVADTYFGGGENPAKTIWLSGVQCSGDEGDVGDCNHSPWSKSRVAPEGCTHANDVGLCCFGIQTAVRGKRIGPSDWPICPEAQTDFARLSECDYDKCLLSIYHDDDWGTVCNSGFSSASATVLCTSLGFSAGGIPVPFGSNRKGQIWLSQVQCKGTESNIEWCQHTPWGLNDCDHSMDVGICCHGQQSSIPKKSLGPSFRCVGEANSADSGSTRLVDCTSAGCRLEIRHDDKWGTVCDSGFNENAAKVVCRSLGLPGGYVITHYGSRYGLPGYSKIWLSDVRCNGQESWVGSCGHKMWGDVGRCGHDQDVGVCCGDLPSITTVQDMRDAGLDPPLCQQTGQKVVLSQDCGFGGWTVQLGLGQYAKFGGGNTCDDDGNLCVVTGCHLPGSDLSSISVPSGVEVILYDGENFSGSSIAYVGPRVLNCLVSDGWNDRARSMKITFP